jgi:membrane protease YdiL (CAAX protease family)
LTALAVFVFFTYFPYGWCAATGEPRETYGLVWTLNKRAAADVAAASIFTLLPLTFLSLVFFRSGLPPQYTVIISNVFSGLAAAVAEETFFRGWAQSMLRKKFSRYTSIFLASSLFGLAHLASPYAPFALLAFFPGLVMGFLRDRHGSVLPAIIYHWAGNIWAIWFYPQF